MRRRFLKRNSRGTALVETALVLPLLCTLLFAAAEFGFLYENTYAAQNMLREAARTAGVTGTEYGVDHYILQAIGDTAADLKGAKIEMVSIYKPTGPGPGSTILPACGPTYVPPATQTGALGTFGQCNIYLPNSIPGYEGTGVALNSTNFALPSAGSTCFTPSVYDKNYCPGQSGSGRTNTYPNPGEIGIYIRMKHKAITGFLFNNRSIEKYVIMQLDPDPRTL